MSSHDPGAGNSSRRDILKLSAAAAAALATSGLTLAEEAEAAAVETIWNGGMPYRKLPRTGDLVSLVGLGGYHMGAMKTQDEAVKLIRSAVDRGVTFMDNCWDYHDGKSEVWMGHALKDGYRDKVYLMTKIDGQTKVSCAKQIDESLQRLQTDRIDLMQHHEVIRPADPAKIFAKAGAHEAMREAQKAGKIRHIGFTGHKDPAVHLAMIEACDKHNYPLDAVQMPLNVLDAHYKSFEKQVLPVLIQKKIAPLAMKTLAAGHIIKNKIASPIECLHYAMNLPTTVVITGMDSMQVLDQAIEAARTFKPMSRQQVAALLERTGPKAADGKHEPFKTTNAFDGTAHNPHWLG